MKKVSIVWLVAPLFLGGCAVHSPMLGFNRTELTHLSGQTYPAHTDQIFVSTAKLPASIQYERIGQVDVGKVWWGDYDWVKKDMADHAREVGGNAVVEVNVWKQPAGWAWAAPHGNGQIIKVLNPAALQSSGVAGSLY